MLKGLEIRSDSLTQYKDAKLFTQCLMLGAAGSTTLTEVCIGFSSWWRDRHILSDHVAGGVQKVSMHGAPLDVLCDLLPVFEPVEQLVYLDMKDPQESNMKVAALKLSEVEQALSGSSQMTMALFDCYWLQSTPEWFFSLCISSLLKGAARSKRMTNVQLAHSEEHRPQVEEVLTYLNDLSVEERRRIGRGQCTLESGLVCPRIEVLPISYHAGDTCAGPTSQSMESASQSNQPHCSSNDPSNPILDVRETSMTGTEPDTDLMEVETGSRKGKRSATEGAPFLPKMGKVCSD